jgi:nucleoside-diphosphate-sugar epimerase
LEHKLETPRILITGGSGFIGTNAVQHWLERGYQVLNFDIRPPQNPKHRRLWTKGEIRSLTELKSAYESFRPHYLLHLAARTDLDERNDLKGYAANIEGVRNIVEIAGQAPDLRRAIFASSRMVCRIGYQPRDDEDYSAPNLYGESKVQGERIVRESGLPCEWLIVRPTSIWGPWFDVPYKQFFLAIRSGRYFNPGDHNAAKSFGFVGNTIWQIDRLFEAQAEAINQRTLYLCDYPPLRVRQWAEMIRESWHASRIINLPFRLLRVVALTGDLLDRAGVKKVPLTSFRLDNLVTEMVYDTSLLEKICGPLRYDLEEGVRRTVEWLSNYQSA